MSRGLEAPPSMCPSAGRNRASSPAGCREESSFSRSRALCLGKALSAAHCRPRSGCALLLPAAINNPLVVKLQQMKQLNTLHCELQNLNSKSILSIFVMISKSSHDGIGVGIFFSLFSKLQNVSAHFEHFLLLTSYAHV